MRWGGGAPKRCPSRSTRYWPVALEVPKRSLQLSKAERLGPCVHHPYQISSSRHVALPCQALCPARLTTDVAIATACHGLDAAGTGRQPGCGA